MMNKKGLVGIIIILGILLVVGFFWFAGERDGKKEIKCVPESCCHATGCVLASDAPNCSGIMCSMVCSGPLDCGAGHCEYIHRKCEIVKNE